MRYVTYRLASGEIIGGGDSVALPAPSGGVGTLEIGPKVRADPLLDYVVGADVVAREPLAMVPREVLAGATLAVPLPQLAQWRLGDVAGVGSISRPMPTAGVFVLELVGKYLGTAAITVVDLVAEEATLLASIDAQAGDVRRKWLTVTAGQSDAYREKMADVVALNGLGGTVQLILAALTLIADAQQRARWPFLYAEMKAAGLANLVVARDAIVAAANGSRQARAEVEYRRRAAKNAVRAAATLAGKRAAARVDWTGL